MINNLKYKLLLYCGRNLGKRGLVSLIYILNYYGIVN